MSYNQYFQAKLSDLQAKNLYRQPKISVLPTQKLLNFCSNDYLGLAQHRLVKNAAIKAIKQHGLGSMASRYVFSGNSFHQKLEKEIAKLKKCDSAIALGSGYLSGVGIIPALVNIGDLIIADKLIHSSLIDGCKLSGANLIRFKHNDIEHCRKILQIHKNKENYKKILIITETVFSMDGDLGKVDELLLLAKENDCLLLTDDAHGLGVLKHQYKKYDGHLQCGTLSKAAGGYGGYACGSNLIIDYLRNFTRTSIYSTALPAGILAANLQAIKIISKDQKLGKKALENAQYFLNLIQNKTSTKDSFLADTKLLNFQIKHFNQDLSTIVPIIIGDAKKTLLIAKKLKQDGFLISAIRPPTVENGKSRLRITFCANHKKKDIEKLAELIIKYCDPK